MTINDADYIYMARAIKLAEKGKYTTHPNPRVGCVLVKDGKIIDIGNVQYRIFTTLLHARGSVVTKDILYECLEHISDTALRVAITKIKQRLEIDIKNIRGKGYIIEKL